MCYSLNNWALLCSCHIFRKVAPSLSRIEELTPSWQVVLFLCFSCSCPGKWACHTRLIQGGWTSTMRNGKAIAQSSTVVIWSIRSIQLQLFTRIFFLQFLFNFLPFFFCFSANKKDFLLGKCLLLGSDQLLWSVEYLARSMGSSRRGAFCNESAAMTGLVGELYSQHDGISGRKT